MATSKNKKGTVSRGTVPSPVLKIIGQQLMDRRNELDMSLQDSQAKSGISYVTISPLERGLATNLSFATLEKLTEAYDLDIEVRLIKRPPKKGGRK